MQNSTEHIVLKSSVISIMIGLLVTCLIDNVKMANAQTTAIRDDKVLAIGHGGGSTHSTPMDEMTPLQRVQIWSQLDTSLAALATLAAGKTIKNTAIPNTTTMAATVAFEWPLRANGGFKGVSASMISGFVDHNRSYPNQLQDYQCGTRTYDTAAGYNHQGTDIALWPDAWNVMANGLVDIVAAAPGTIIFRQDGNFDQSCAFNNNDWNAVYIQHADGSIAWYGHMKRGSVTTKQIGERVAVGEYLGKVGSSGNSTGPHLHLEIYDANRVLLDPFAGQCNTWNSQTLWREQRAYQAPTLNRLYTAATAPQFSSCAGCKLLDASRYFEKSVFSPGETVVFMTTYQDQLNTLPTEHRIYKPDGSLWTQWTGTSNVAYYSSSYWYWTYPLDVTSPSGVWSFEATFNNQTVRMPFTVSPPAAAAKRGVTDIAGNGHGALLLRNATAQTLSANWVANAFVFTPLADPGSNYRLIAAADFNNDDKTDLAYQDMTQGVFGDVFVRSAFAGNTDVKLRNVKLPWIVEAVGDLDGDGFADMVFRFRGDDGRPDDTGVSYIWFTNGTSVQQVRKRGGAPLSWTLLGAADLNGDGAADMIYISPTGTIKALMATPLRTCANLAAGNVPAGFTVLKLADFTGNRLGDLLMRDATGVVQVVSLNAHGITLPPPSANPDDPNASCSPSDQMIPGVSYALPATDPTWQFYGATDLNGDGIVDIVWQQPNGQLTVWLMNMRGATPTVITNAGIAPTGYAVFQP